MIADDIWNDLFGGFDRMNKRIEDMFSQMDMGGSDVKTYGYTMYQGPDGIPHVREFGNCGGGTIPRIDGAREPLTDVTQEGDVVRAVAEIPGVDKGDISLECTGSTLSIRVDTPGKRFCRDLALPCRVDVDSARAEYNNGLLEVTMDVAGQTKGRSISIS